MSIYEARVNQNYRKWTKREPEVNRKWNASDLQAQGAYTLRSLKIEALFSERS